MAREIIDIRPSVAITPITGIIKDREEAERMGARIVAQIRTASFQERFYDVEVTYEVDHRCSFCKATWISETSEWNDGCCPRDEANDPARLAELRREAGFIACNDFYSVYDGKRSAVVISWPETLASATVAWIDAGRPADQVAALRPLIRRCSESEWCTVWTDPGPSGCSLARIPDQVMMDERPSVLGDDLLRLITDMGLDVAVAA